MFACRGPLLREFAPRLRSVSLPAMRGGAVGIDYSVSYFFLAGSHPFTPSLGFRTAKILPAWAAVGYARSARALSLPFRNCQRLTLPESRPTGAFMKRVICICLFAFVIPVMALAQQGSAASS